MAVLYPHVIMRCVIKGLYCINFVTPAAGNNGVDLSERTCRLICTLVVPILHNGKQTILKTRLSYHAQDKSRH